MPISGTLEFTGSSEQENNRNEQAMTEQRAELRTKIAAVNEERFGSVTMEVFSYQSKNNPVYSKFLELIHVRPGQVNQPQDIPFLPIEFFKQHAVVSSLTDISDFYFTSSSTSGTGISRHYVPDPAWYETAFLRSFIHALGDPAAYTFRFLLPSYLEREGSSLIYMAGHLLKVSGKGGFYLNNYEQLATDLHLDRSTGQKTLLLGVSFALLDFANKFPMDLNGILVMETGGMKGRGPEITRKELHDRLCAAFNLNGIASEYGMTELMSQAYSIENGIFLPPPWMKVQTGQVTDPFCRETSGRTGRLLITDLYNLDSCAFISTSDAGRVHPDGSFEILGRLDHSDVRGCNLMF